MNTGYEPIKRKPYQPGDVIPTLLGYPVICQSKYMPKLIRSVRCTLQTHAPPINVPVVPTIPDNGIVRIGDALHMHPEVWPLFKKLIESQPVGPPAAAGPTG